MAATPKDGRSQTLDGDSCTACAFARRADRRGCAGLRPERVGDRSATAARASAHKVRPELDGLRAIAALLVLAFHSGMASMVGGYVGVDVFFVLSGFLITGLLLDGRGLLGFYALRPAA